MLWGALIGAVVGAAIELVGQRLSGKPIDWGRVGQAALVGAVAGLVGGAVAGALLRSGTQAAPQVARATLGQRLVAGGTGGGSGSAAGRVTDNALSGRPLHDGVVEHAVAGVALGTASVPVEAALRRTSAAVVERTRAAVAAPRLPVKLHADAQGKHVPGHRNWQAPRPGEHGRSEVTHPRPQELLDRFAGRGQPIPNGRAPGEAGFKERVDFGLPIGRWVDPQGVAHPTTRGIIHYGKNGAHIVPAQPAPLVLRGDATAAAAAVAASSEGERPPPQKSNGFTSQLGF